MEKIDTTEMWRRVPPEEKFELMAKAHASGVGAAVSAVVICGTLSLGLRTPVVLWASLAVAPLIFQAAAAQKWRHLKPRTILEYLAARTASRRFAYASRSLDLSVRLILRGEWCEEEVAVDQGSAAPFLEQRSQFRPVWITLFGDALVVIAETPGGARLEFGTVFTEVFQFESFQDSNGKPTLRLFREKGLAGEVRPCLLRSKYVAALEVLEKMIHQLVNEAKRKAIQARIEREKRIESEQKKLLGMLSEAGI